MPTKILREKMFGDLRLVIYDKHEGKYGYEIFVKTGEMLDFGYTDTPEAAEDFMKNLE